jgi:hypothetical protein
LKSKVSEAKDKLSALSLGKIKHKLYTFKHTIAQSEHFHFRVRNGGIEKRDQTKARLKISKTNIKSCSFMSGI